MFGHGAPVQALRGAFRGEGGGVKVFLHGDWRGAGLSVSVYHGARHQPLVRLDEKGEALLRLVGATHVHLSLSHTETLAVAVAALVRG